MTTATALHGPERHEALAGNAWSDGTVRAAMQRWADAALADFEPGRGWRAHPREEGGPPGEPLAEVYGGAGGAIRALEHLAEAGAVDQHWDFGGFVPGMAQQQVAALGDSQHGTASFLIGESGLRLLAWKLTRDDDEAQRLFEVVQGNLTNPVREPLWGSSGTVPAAIATAEHTGQARWARLVQRAVQALWDEMEPIEAAAGAWGWVQDLYGRVGTLIGAGHGFMGNVYPALRGAAFIPAALRDGFAQHALAFLQATALRDGDAVNWRPRVPPPAPADKPPLVQDGHGAPGIVCRLAPLPRSVPDADQWDQLPLQAGELTWRAGPLTKGVAFCHGTAGNAHALLHLPVCPHRRRALAGAGPGLCDARHRAGRARTPAACQGRHTLWTGDPGMACVLWDGIVGRPGFPTLDRF